MSEPLSHEELLHTLHRLQESVRVESASARGRESAALRALASHLKGADAAAAVLSSLSPAGPA